MTQPPIINGIFFHDDVDVIDDDNDEPPGSSLGQHQVIWFSSEGDPDRSQ